MRTPLVLALLLALACPRALRAAEESVRTTAVRANQRALQLYAEGKYEEALSVFEAVYGLHPARAILYSLGQTHRHLRHGQQALVYYQRYLDAGPQLGPKERQTLERQMEEARALVDAERAEPKAPPQAPAPLVVQPLTLKRPPLGIEQTLLPHQGRRKAGRQIAGAVLLCAATLTIVGGAVGLGLRERFVDEYNNDDLCLDDLGHTREETCGPRLLAAERAQAGGAAALAVGAGLLGSSLGLLLFQGKAERRVQVAPFLGPGAGVTITGGF